jgi:hypothetical protein
VIGFYFLAQNFFSRWVSLAATLLFGTQPLLFGHAWINPKDTPHMSMFIIVVAVGFHAVDRWFSTPARPSQDPHPIEKTFPQARLLLTALTIITILLWGSAGLYPLADQVVEYAYLTSGESLIGKLFQAATTAGSLEGYKILTSLKIAELQRWVAFITPAILGAGFLAAQRNNRLGHWQADLVLLGAAAVWGIAISTRVLTIAAGGIVGLHALLKWKQKAIRPLMIYTLTSSIFSFISWPFLWVSGPNGLFDSLIIFSDFSHWRKKLLFEGQLLFPEELPQRYIPKLMAVQFTEPMVVLAVIGFVIGLIYLWQNKKSRGKLSLVFAWLILPFLYLLITRPVQYNNFRQFLFFITPLFILAGFSLELIAGWLKKPLINILLVAAMLIPGIVSIYKLHPYQYIYYNQFTGGVEGAFRQYDLDYWFTSLKETMDFLEENVPVNSKILTWLNDPRARFYANQRFKIESMDSIPEEEYTQFDYVILPSRNFLDQQFFPDAPILYSVERDNATLMVVKEIP